MHDASWRASFVLRKSSFLPDQNFFFGVTDFCFLFPLD